MATEEVLAMRHRIKTAQQKRKEVAARKKILLGEGENGKTTNVPDRSAVLGTPFIRKGESVMSSRGYSYARLAGLKMKVFEEDQCKEEVQVSKRLKEAMRECSGFRSLETAGSHMAPLDPAFMLGEYPIIDSSYALELKSMMWAGVANGDDPEQAMELTRKAGVVYNPDTQKVGGTTQSAIQQNLGGALVPFPELGPLIPLLRNRNAIMSAGAQVFPLPPSGRIAFPRQSSPVSTYHVGESVKITQSNVGTDQLTLVAKKIGAYLITNNELIRYGGPIVEQMFRNDMTISLGLQLDFDLLQAEGSDNVSAGLIGYPGVVTFIPTTIGAAGNTMAPQDIYTWIGQIRANNGMFEGWIIRPELLYAMVGKRASVLGGGDQLGLFLFDLIREFDAASKTAQYYLGGYKVIDTPNVPANRSKGGATTLTAAYGGQWSDYKLGIYGTIEFATATQGDNLFPQDQTGVRAILAADGGPQHPGVFGVADQLLLSTVSS